MGGGPVNGLPTPVFNFIRRIVLFLVASTATDNLKINASPMAAGVGLEDACRAVNAQLEALYGENKLGRLTREFMRNAAVDRDACLYAWYDPDHETGQPGRHPHRGGGEHQGALWEPNSRDVQAALSAPAAQGAAGGGEAPLRRVRRGRQGHPAGRRGGAFGLPAEEGRQVHHGAAAVEGPGGGRAGVRLGHGVRQGRRNPARLPTMQRLYPVVWLPLGLRAGLLPRRGGGDGADSKPDFVNKLFAMTMISS